MEQASSQATAQYKAALLSGRSLIDLTGGFGIDDAYFAESFAEVVHCELDPWLSEIARHNFKVLGIDNVSCFTGDGFDALNSREAWDCIYVDPSRRNQHKGKVFMLSDCLPDVPTYLNLYFAKAPRVLVKASPMLDITLALSQLGGTRQIHIIAWRNEVRELLFDMERNFIGNPTVTAVNLDTGQPEWTYTYPDTGVAPTSEPLKYLYEPNPAIMKSGGFSQLAHDFGVKKLHRHTHLFTSDALLEFPGRVFRIDKVIPFNKQGQRELSAIKQVNLAVRNFPLTVAQARQKLKISDGGDVYCFLTTGPDEKIALICSKI